MKNQIFRIQYVVFVCALFLKFFDCASTLDGAGLPVIISLGGACEVAWELQQHNLRKESLPFGWLLTPFESLCLLLEHHFEGFLQKENLEKLNWNGCWIKDKRYEIIFGHDFHGDVHWMGDYDQVKAKYMRRIERFYRVLASATSVLFIRMHISKQDSVFLVNLLKKLFPNLNFSLLVVGSLEEHKQKWNLDNISNYYQDVSCHEWPNYQSESCVKAWTFYLKDIGVL